MKTLLSTFLVIGLGSAAVADIPAVAGLEAWLAGPRGERPPLAEQGFAKTSITKEEAARALELLSADHVAEVKVTRAEEVKAKEITIGEHKLRYLSKVFGEKPEGGRSLYISMHGGGGGPARMNDGQWRNQIRLYRPKEGIYLAPRAPTDTWNLWHQAHIDPLFDRLIENLVAFEGVNRDKVYIMGYSAGGDGVYQLAPRMSDRFAAAAMMAGHPNETKPIGLRNIPFALQVGEKDAPYKRNQIAAKWKDELAALRKADPEGYEHFVEVRKGKGHWMDLEDKVAVPWMAKYRRQRFPERVVWKQDDVTHRRSYWLALPEDQIKRGQLVVAKRDGQRIEIEKAEDVARLTVMLNDEMLDLDKDVKIFVGKKMKFNGKLERRIADIHRTLTERGDAGLVFSAAVSVDVD